MCDISCTSRPSSISEPTAPPETTMVKLLPWGMVYHMNGSWIYCNLDIVCNIEACIGHHLNCTASVLVDNFRNFLAGLSTRLDAGNNGSGRHLHYHSPIRRSMLKAPPPRNVRARAARSSVMSSS